MEEDYWHYGESLREARKRCGLTQQDVAKQLGVSKSTISKYENGERHIKNIHVFDVFAKLYKTDAMYLMSGKTGEENMISIRQELHRLTLKEIMDSFNKLNEDGQQVAADRIAELTEIPRYQKESGNKDGE